MTAGRAKRAARSAKPDARSARLAAARGADGDGGSLFDLGCIADLCVDLVMRGDEKPRYGQEEQLFAGYALELGGSGTIVCAQFAKLGGRVRLVGAVGDDDLGAVVRRRLAEENLPDADIAVRPDLPTGLGVALARSDGDRAILTVSGALDGTEPSRLTPALAASCRHWHVAAFYLLGALRPAWHGFLGAARRAGATVSIDPNWAAGGDWNAIRALLPLVDVFMPNEREALAISGEHEVNAAGRALSRQGPLVVVKRGARGSVLFADGRRVAEREGTPPDGKVADAIGAGDNFDAGFLRAWLDGADPASCLALGDRCARASLLRAGGIRGQLLETMHATG
ncbi:MAG TPA: carbohydrate kinase family protein [Planctomycetota bacterium]|nr:carbohydrate kinase family protein [Planctomycetota bacterium]